MDNPNRFTDDDRKAILTCLAEEAKLKAEGSPHYREAVTTACEIILRLNPEIPASSRQWGEEITITDEEIRKKLIHASTTPFIPDPTKWWNKD